MKYQTIERYIMKKMKIENYNNKLININNSKI